MIAASWRRTTGVLTFFITVALTLPALALAQGDEGQVAQGGGGGDTGLAQTGLDAWQVGLAGAFCLALALVLFRTAKPARD